MRCRVGGRSNLQTTKSAVGLSYTSLWQRLLLRRADQHALEMVDAHSKFSFVLFPPMVSPPTFVLPNSMFFWKSFVFFGNSLYILESICIIWKSFVFLEPILLFPLPDLRFSPHLPPWFPHLWYHWWWHAWAYGTIHGTINGGTMGGNVVEICDRVEEITTSASKRHTKSKQKHTISPQNTKYEKHTLFQEKTHY